MKKQTSLIKNQKGAILLEFVLCFPILFVLFLFVMQLAQIMITWQVVHYAAYMGARSSMTTNLLYRQSTAEKVVKRVLAVVSASPDDEKGNSGDKDKKENKHADDKYAKLDGWGYLPATKYLEKQVDVDISKIDLIPGGVRCTVKFKMFLHVPVAGALISFFAKENKTEEEKKEFEKLLDEKAGRNPALLAKYSNDLTVKQGEKKDNGKGGSDDIKYPYIVLTSSSVMSIPYSTLKYPLIQ